MALSFLLSTTENDLIKTGNRTVNYLSLDIEGAELQVRIAVIVKVNTETVNDEIRDFKVTRSVICFGSRFYLRLPRSKKRFCFLLGKIKLFRH
jgi:hypothetical protein